MIATKSAFSEIAFGACTTQCMVWFGVSNREAKPLRQAVIYLRVSTIEQTTANQERELREIAGRMGCEIVKVYRDHGISGAKGRDKRPAFDKLCRDAARREFDIVMLPPGRLRLDTRPSLTGSFPVVKTIGIVVVGTGGTPRAARDLRGARVHRRWRAHELWYEPSRCVSTGRRLCRPHSQGREPWRPSDPAAGEIRVRDQYEDGQGTRSHCSQ
jgi:hypothetical protein